MINPECEHCKSRYKSVFCNLNAEQVDVLSQDKGCTIYKKGDVIFYENRYPQGLFCVNEGKIKISPTGSEGKEQIVRLAKEGDVLGYRALLSGEKYNCSAVAIDDCSVCFIPRETFFKLLNESAELPKA